MKYLKLYDSFIKLIKEGVEGKKFILLSGPSASGKTYLARQKGVVNWYENTNADKVLIGTDNFMGPKCIEPLSKLCLENGLPELAKFKEDGIWVMESHKDFFKNWQESASDAEKMKYEEIKNAVGFSKEKTTSPETGNADGRVCGMAWTAFLLKSKVIIFDDISTSIKNYYPDTTDILIFTPLDWYVKNITSRNNSPDASKHIDVNNEDTAFYQYCNWFQATDKPDLDNKVYTSENVEKMLSDAGHKNPKEILNLLGVTGELEKGFYLTTKPVVKPNEIINSRDKSTGRAKDVSSLSF